MSNITEKKENIYKFTIIALIVIVGVLTVLLLTGRKSMNEMAAEQDTISAANIELKAELNALLEEYNAIKYEYDSVLVFQDSIIQANAREIERLIAQQVDYRRIRRQLNLLREITQNYVREIDSLHAENRVLKAEKDVLQREVERYTQETRVLTQSKEDLEGKVEVASALRAFQISAQPLRLRGAGREEATDRAARTERVKVCFTVAANPVANAGNQNAYIRIADPAGRILRLSDGDEHAFIHGVDTLQWSVRGEFNYRNTDTDLCVYWDRREDFPVGTYLVSIYTDEYKLGETQFSLR